jgi:Fe-S-cluster-containing dehydrogenase component
MSDKMKNYYTSFEDSCLDEGCSCTDLPPVAEVEKTSGFTRRSFLKTAGFSFGALFVACTKAPVKKAIPFLIQPEEILPGKAIWYASTSNACEASCAVHVKNRDGRPIKLEGNPEHPLNQGGLCSQCQTSLIELYDSKRILHPLLNGKKSNWEIVDKQVVEKLKKIDKEIVLLTNSVTSPSLANIIAKFKIKYKNITHIQMDEYSYSAILDSHEKNYGKRFIPQYKFDKADLILSIDADFLGSWISPIQFTKDFQKNRKLDAKNISKLIHIESHMSLTGANADERIVLSPSEILNFTLALDTVIQGEITDNKYANKIASLLKHNKGKSLVVSGINDIKIQLLINRINHKLGNVNKTLNHKEISRQYAGSDTEVLKLIEKLNNNKIGGILIAGVNPVYSLPNGEEFAKNIKSLDLSVSFSDKHDETTENCKIVAPDRHYLESWNDNEIVSGLMSMTQPVLQPFGENRSFRMSLNYWLGKKTNERDLLRDYWRGHFSSRVNSTQTFTRFWNNLVHDGFTLINPIKLKLRAFNDYRPSLTISKVKGIEFVLYRTSQLSNGRHAENPWLQELPDPITKITWDNYASISQEISKKYKLEKGNVIKIKSGKNSIQLPVFLQPGQQHNTISIALGYGRKGTERFHEIGPDWIEKKSTVKKGEKVGKRVSHFINNNFSYSGKITSIIKTNLKWDLAATQTYDTLQNPENTAPAIMPKRPFVQETTFKEYKKDPTSGRYHGHPVTTMWKDDHVYKGHHWGMALDISACTGCSSCVVSCQVENNIPVVGKDEVLRKRDMHWMRLDRYYSGKGENVDVSFQAMMCQHCDNAPCEPVCPVLATVHSTEGLNEQVYNRCIGTRFCANNCPYKVRRFNWFEYAREDVMENMVLNPDVTVRSRGVMEKCSMCIQRIQEARFEAKKNGKSIQDGDVQLACQQSCPANAIVFGDLNDPNSKISKLVNSGRHYKVLEELNIRPTVGYLTQVRNREEDSKKGKHHG